MFIIDIGSGNTLRSIDEACKIVKTVQDLKISDSFVKFQLFQKVGNNIPLDLEIFERATKYCHIIGMPYGVSVFDRYSLDVAIHSGALRFIKLANNKDSHDLLEFVPDEDRVIISTDDPNFKVDRHDTDIIYCVSKYPAQEKDYDKFGDKLKRGISDHTSYKTNWNLFKKFQPKIYEVHFCLKRDKNNLDGGEFARQPEEFKKLTNNLYDTSIEEVMKEEYEDGLYDTSGIK